MSEDIVRVLRVIEYVGPRKWVEETVARSVHGTKHFSAPERSIRAATIGAYPEVLEQPGSELLDKMADMLEKEPLNLPTQEPPAAPEIPAPAVVEDVAPIQLDGSPCPGCGNYYIHAWLTGLKPCPFSPEAKETAPRLTLDEER